MGTLIDYDQFKAARLKRLKARAEKSPAQLASATILKRLGYTYQRVTPKGNWLYVAKDENYTLIAVIEHDGQIKYSRWANDE